MSANTGTTPIGVVNQPYKNESRPLAVHVRTSLERYFDELNGQEPNKLYDLVLSEIEQPLLEVVMERTRGNISKAATFLGLNRATLRKKLQKYRINN
ncbi:MAG TPA: DNA-binding transcriptional regulator Fis [Gammaproteobacteria bacterium]|nr:DNA-binding transcriptional regulator Fis [Gammaproteobacteria bacterium]|tara:strand:- start:4611 stop:4901 length:291 start_codon:yes stop_codon:yes gene_type:complete